MTGFSHDGQTPKVPGNLVATALGHEPDKAELDGVNGQRQCDKVSSAAAGPRKHEFCARHDDHRNELHRRGIGRGEPLQLSRPGEGCDGETERVFGGDERDNSFTYNQSSHNTVTFSTMPYCNHNCT